MKTVYPVVMSNGQGCIIANIPDFNIGTQGRDFAEAIESSRDVIGLIGVDMEDDGETIPEPSDIHEIDVDEDEIVTLVDVDFDDYRRKNDNKVVRKNCTIPQSLCYEAERRGMNFSRVLTEALKEKLEIA